jgi:hypothetical protein
MLPTPLPPNWLEPNANKKGRGCNLYWEPVLNKHAEPVTFDDLASAELFCRQGFQFVKNHGRFECSFHVKCMKIAEVNKKFEVLEYGAHTDEIKSTTYGIPKALRPCLDKYLKVGYGPMQAVAVLKSEFREKPEYAPLLAVLIQESSNKKLFLRKVQTRKTDLRRVAAGEQINTRFHLESYLKEFMVSQSC